MKAFRQRIAHYACLPEQSWMALDATPKRKRQLMRHHSLVREGERIRTVQILERGMAIRKRHLEDGRRQIINFILPGDVFDLQAMIDTRSDHAVEAITPCDVTIINRLDFMQLLSRHPQLVSALWWAGIQEEAILREHLVLLGQRRAIEKVAHLLIELRRRLILAGAAGENEPLALPITRRQIADALGLSPVHVSRTVSRLKRMGLVKTGAVLEILDPEALAAISGFDPEHLHLQARPLPDEWLARMPA